MSLQIVQSVAALRQTVTAWRMAGLRVGLAPTMGGLHEGHLALIDRLAQSCDRIVASIFVNPTQFAQHEDLDTYPRDRAGDIAFLQTRATDLLYAPAIEEIYPPDFATRIALEGPALGLESDARPHFFAGVATVVAKLFLQCQPDAAAFGEKDYQQLLVVKQLVRDLDLAVEIVAVPTLREADGLALSSRNAYLTNEHRQIAPQLYRVLTELAQSPAPIAQAEADAIKALRAAGFDKVDYATIRDADTLGAVTDKSQNRRALIAAWLGKTRLIDNIACP